MTDDAIMAMMLPEQERPWCRIREIISWPWLRVCFVTEYDWLDCWAWGFRVWFVNVEFFSGDER